MSGTQCHEAHIVHTKYYFKLSVHCWRWRCLSILCLRSQSVLHSYNAARQDNARRRRRCGCLLDASFNARVVQLTLTVMYPEVRRHQLIRLSRPDDRYIDVSLIRSAVGKQLRRTYTRNPQHKVFHEPNHSRCASVLQAYHSRSNVLSWRLNLKIDLMDIAHASLPTTASVLGS